MSVNLSLYVYMKEYVEKLQIPNLITEEWIRLKGYEKYYYALNVLKLKNIDLDVYKTNLREVQYYEKVGFIKDGDGKTDKDIHMIYNILE